MEKKKITIEVAKPGIYGSGGAVITEQMLRQMASTFSGDAPVCFGHSGAADDKAPRCGSIVALKYKDGVLLADMVLDEWSLFSFDNGRYPCWSLGAEVRASDTKWYLHHLALLGAVPPAIKGLKEVARVDLSDAAHVQYFYVGKESFQESGNPSENSTNPTAQNLSDPVSNPNSLTLASKLERIEKELEAQKRMTASVTSARLGDVLKGRVPVPVVDGFVALAQNMSPEQADEMIRLASLIPEPLTTGRVVQETTEEENLKVGGGL